MQITSSELDAIKLVLQFRLLRLLKMHFVVSPLMALISSRKHDAAYSDVHVAAQDLSIALMS